MKTDTWWRVTIDGKWVVETSKVIDGGWETAILGPARRSDDEMRDGHAVICRMLRATKQGARIAHERGMHMVKVAMRALTNKKTGEDWGDTGHEWQ